MQMIELAFPFVRLVKTLVGLQQMVSYLVP